MVFPQFYWELYFAYTNEWEIYVDVSLCIEWLRVSVCVYVCVTEYTEREHWINRVN